MRDELYDRDYQAGRAALHDGIDGFVRNVAEGLALLHRKQWSAPWKVRQDGVHSVRNACPAGRSRIA